MLDRDELPLAKKIGFVQFNWVKLFINNSDTNPYLTGPGNKKVSGGKIT
jgi:hypothetical protein